MAIQHLFQRQVKMNRKRQQQSNSSNSSSYDCSCQILLDTSLSDVGDSQCTCSDCLEANLNAFNEFKNQNTSTNQINKRKIANIRGQSTVHKKTEVKPQTKEKGRENKSIDRFNPTKKTKKRWGQEGKNGKEKEENDEFEEEEKIEDEELNQFLLITKNRTRKYVQERKKMNLQEKKQKQYLKQKIKRNLEILKTTAKVLQQKNAQMNEKGEKEQMHPRKWNHSIYKCQCNGSRMHKDECCRSIKVKEKLDTNLNKIQPDFQLHRDQFLEQNKRKRLELQKPSKELCSYDKCKNHHNRTDPQKIKKIQRFIEKEAKKYKKSVVQDKKKKEQEEKVRQAKLRAIDIKSKEIVNRSKKVNDQISRTSFQLSIDHFDTFSELRKENEQRKEVRKMKRKAKEDLIKGRGNLEDAIYKIDEDDMEQFGEVKQEKKNKVIKQVKKGDLDYDYEGNEWCEKIVREAKITSPKQIKKHQTKKQVKKKSTNLDAGKEERQRKRLEEEMEKRKREIMDQYKKRNTNKPAMNKPIREEYEKRIQKGPKEQYKTGSQTVKKDVYRQNYKYQAGKDVKQVNTHGDPLLQEYVYHDGQRLKNVASFEKDRDVFTQNINSLTGKMNLKL